MHLQLGYHSCTSFVELYQRMRVWRWPNEAVCHTCVIPVLGSAEIDNRQLSGMPAWHSVCQGAPPSGAAMEAQRDPLSCTTTGQGEHAGAREGQQRG